jgi:hypothetical protein
MSVKVPLFKGDLGGSESDREGEKTRPRGVVQNLSLTISQGFKPQASVGILLHQAFGF